MPIFAYFNHLTQDILQILVSGLESSVDLRSVWGRLVAFDPIFGQYFVGFSLEMRPIIGYDFLWYAVTTNDILLDELSYLPCN